MTEYAEGGTVSGGRQFLIGDKVPEYVVPIAVMRRWLGLDDVDED